MWKEGNFGRSMQQRAPTGAAGPIGPRPNALGITDRAEVEAFWKLVKIQNEVGRGQTIVGSTNQAKRFTVLLKGVACLSTRHEDGARQIHAFHHAGDFLGLQNFLFPQTEELSEVQALTGCSVGTIERDTMDQAIQRYPTLGQALWQAAFAEAGGFRRRLVVSRRPALKRVAHVLSELLARLGTNNGAIPLTQTDVADAADLSAVHVNRIFQELRELGVLAKRRLIEVVNLKRLHELADFDARLLNTGEASPRWIVRIDQ
jgi:CRP-like cAMP-binding protein